MSILIHGGLAGNDNCFHCAVVADCWVTWDARFRTHVHAVTISTSVHLHESYELHRICLCALAFGPPPRHDLPYAFTAKTIGNCRALQETASSNEEWILLSVRMYR
jgi:hypothetical protein